MSLGGGLIDCTLVETKFNCLDHVTVHLYCNDANRATGFSGANAARYPRVRRASLQKSCEAVVALDKGRKKCEEEVESESLRTSSPIQRFRYTFW